MRRHRLWIPIGVASLAAVIGGVVWFLARRSLSEADNWASVGGLVLSLAVGVPGLVVSVVALRVAQRPGESRPLEEFADALVAEYRRERGVRDVNDLLPVRWHGGRVDAAADAFRLLDRSRLVILGEPGAGKTVVALELALGLLSERDRGDRVPVILPVASWNPIDETPQTWMERRLIELYPALGTTHANGTLASHWIWHEMLLPVFDGLDEMAEPARAVALDSLNRWLLRSEPLVVTCRTDDYHRLLAGDVLPLADATVVELAPLGIDDVLAYLRGATPPPSRAKWDGFATTGPAAEALSTPLMAGLARASYSRTSTDPARLSEFTTRADAEEHLLAGYVPALYGDDERALRSLRTLAWLLERRGTQQLLWWHIPLVTHRVAFLSVVTGLFVLIGLVNEVFVPFPIMRRYTVVIGLAVGLALIATGRQSSPPSRTRVRLRTMPDDWSSGMVRSMAIGVAGSLAAGFGFGLVYSYVSLVSGGVPAFAEGLEVGASIALVSVVPMCLAMLLTAPADIAGAITPRSTLRADRTRTLLVSLAAAASVGVLVWFQVAPWVGVFVGPALGVTLWLLSAWGALTVARLALLLRWPVRLTPRVMTFLEDAHRRGVFRQIGTAYHFRHQRLQQHLARTHPHQADSMSTDLRSSALVRVGYLGALTGAAVTALYVYVVAFDRLSETELTRLLPLWLLPALFGSFGVFAEAVLVRRPHLLRQRNALPLVLAATACLLVVVQWFMAAVFPGL
ncbi:NACHT domain-containing protein [Saccharothrix stipae]